MKRITAEMSSPPHSLRRFKKISKASGHCEVVEPVLGFDSMT